MFAAKPEPSADLTGVPAQQLTLSSRLMPPLPTGHLIARRELCARILDASTAKLVLMRAPAGFGKTSLMLQVLQHLNESGLPTSWLTLSKSDNDIGRFTRSLAATLASAIPGLTRQKIVKADNDNLVFALLDRLATHPAPFALFLDDVESLTNPATLAIISEVIDRLPRGAQLIIGSRGLPDLSLGRIRAHGRVIEIGAEQLRFSETEVDVLLRKQCGLQLQLEDVRRLHRRTEGWAAALWLASVSLEGRKSPSDFIANFSGSNTAVGDYLVEDVFSRQSEDIRHFLLHTSILTHLNEPLCNVVAQRTDSGALLHSLEKAHLFLIPLHSAQTSHPEYRYHGMFAQFLRTQLARQLPGEVSRLHMAAAQWFLSENCPVPAIEHVLAAGNTEFALTLLNKHAQALLDQGRVGLLSRWLDPLLATGLLDTHPMLQVVHAWAVCFARGPRAAASVLKRLEAHADGAPEVRAQRLAMRPLFMALNDYTDEAQQLTTTLFAELPSSAPFVRGFLEIVLANLAIITGRPHEALKFVDAVRRGQSEISGSFNVALSEAAEGAIDLTQGRLRRAIARLRLAVQGDSSDDAVATRNNPMAGVLLAEALYEADQSDQAERLLAAYIPLFRRIGIPDQLIIAHVVMARIALDRGEGSRTQQLLAELEQIGQRNGLNRVVASARLERVRIYLLEDRLAAARTELDRCDDQALWTRVAQLSLRANEVETYDVAFARWAIRNGRAAEVIPRLRGELAAAEMACRERRMLTLRLLLAQALYSSSQHPDAMHELALAVRFAAVESYVRAFHVEGTLMLSMLSELREEPSSLRDIGAGIEVFAFIDRLLHGSGSSTAEPMPALPSHQAGKVALADLLTRKELRVLKLAAQGMSNEELAERLFVASTTVRTHLRHINTKLAARNRTEAIAIARRAGLIP